MPLFLGLRMYAEFGLAGVEAFVQIVRRAAASVGLIGTPGSGCCLYATIYEVCVPLV